jgi:hypothetical protein
MAKLDVKFLLLAAILLTSGVSLGIYMGVVHDFALAPVHAHINLVGWVSSALFGIVYALYPQLQERRLAHVHFYLAAPSALLFPLGIYLSIFHQQPLLAIIAANVWAIGVLLFLIQIAGLALARDPNQAHRGAPVFAPAE